MLTVLVHELGHCFASRSVGAAVHGEREKELFGFLFSLSLSFSSLVRRKTEKEKKTHLFFFSLSLSSFSSRPKQQQQQQQQHRNPPLAPRRPRLRRPLLLAAQGPLGRRRGPPDAPAAARLLDGGRGRVVRRGRLRAEGHLEGVAAVEQRVARAGDLRGKICLKRGRRKREGGAKKRDREREKQKKLILFISLSLSLFLVKKNEKNEKKIQIPKQQVQFNVVLFAFNLLLPAYPLDGGRALADLLLMCGVGVQSAGKAVSVRFFGFSFSFFRSFL